MVYFHRVKIYLLAVIFALISFTARAETDLKKLVGRWSTSCTQSQMNGKQGFVIETYEIAKAGEFKFKREWFKEKTCKGKSFSVDAESGTLALGNEYASNGFAPPGTLEADFKVGAKFDLGLLWVDSKYSKLRLSRGMGASLRNTMLGLFEYLKK